MYKNKHIWNVSLPIMLGLLAQNIINVTDTAFLGHVGEVELGASAMGGLFYICLFTIAFGFSTGAQIIIGRRNGEKNYAAIGPVTIQGLFFLLALALALYLFSHAYAGRIMHAIISSDEIWNATMSYLKWRIIGFFFDAFNVIFRAFFVGITRTKVLTANSIVMAATNVALDYIMIFGHCGFPAMGIEGAAIASLFSEGVSTLFFILYMTIAVDRKKYGLARVSHIDFSLVKQVLNISIYTMLQYFISMGTYFLFFIVTERMGQRSLAIANIVRSIYMVMFIPMNALSVTSNTLVSNIIGEGKTSSVIPLVKRISRLSLTIMLACVTLLCLFPETALSIYTSDASLIEESVSSIYTISVALVISSVSSVVFNGVSGTGNTFSAFVLEIIVLAIYSIYIYLSGIYFKFPVSVCFGSEIVYFLGLLVGSALYLRFADWRKKKI